MVGGVTAGLLYEFIFDPSRIRTRSQTRAVPDTEIGKHTPRFKSKVKALADKNMDTQ